MGWSGREWRDGGKVYYLWQVREGVPADQNVRHFHHHVHQHHCSVIIIIIIIVTISIIIILHDYQVISRHADHQHYDCSDYLVTISSSGWTAASIKRTMFCAQKGVAGRAPTKHENSIQTKALSYFHYIHTYNIYNTYNIYIIYTQ